MVVFPKLSKGQVSLHLYKEVKVCMYPYKKVKGAGN